MYFFVCVMVKRPSQQSSSHVGMEPPLPGYHQYFWGVNILLKGTTRQRYLSNPQLLLHSRRSTTEPQRSTVQDDDDDEIRYDVYCILFIFIIKIIMDVEQRFKCDFADIQSQKL